MSELATRITYQNTSKHETFDFVRSYSLENASLKLKILDLCMFIFPDFSRFSQFYRSLGTLLETIIKTVIPTINIDIIRRGSDKKMNLTKYRNLNFEIQLVVSASNKNLILELFLFKICLTVIYSPHIFKIFLYNRCLELISGKWTYEKKN